MADGEERLDFFEEAWWTELPYDLQNEALAWLPVDSVLNIAVSPWNGIPSFHQGNS